MIPRHVVDTTGRHLQRFIPEWRDEFPMRIHERGFAEDGTPAMTGEFMRWLNRGITKRDDEDLSDTRLRLTRAMRRLRKVAPREHEALWLILRGQSIADVSRWLNERAIRLGHPERYSMKDTMVIVASGVHKLAFWY